MSKRTDPSTIANVGSRSPSVSYTMTTPCYADLAERLARVYTWALQDAAQPAPASTAEADRV